MVGNDWENSVNAPNSSTTHIHPIVDLRGHSLWWLQTNRQTNQQLPLYLDGKIYLLTSLSFSSMSIIHQILLNGIRNQQKNIEKVEKKAVISDIFNFHLIFISPFCFSLFLMVFYMTLIIETFRTMDRWSHTQKSLRKGLNVSFSKMIWKDESYGMTTLAISNSYFRNSKVLKE